MSLLFSPLQMPSPRGGLALVNRIVIVSNGMNTPTYNGIICAVVQFRPTLNKTGAFTMNITTIQYVLASRIRI